MKNKILFVAKDMGSASVTLPLLQECKVHSQEVIAVTEGLATSRYLAAAVLPAFIGTVNFTNEPFYLDAEKYLESQLPDMVVTGLGSPIHLEEIFGLAANKLGIKLVECVDFWNGTRRSKAIPDIVLSIDEYDAALSRARHPNARVEVVGNPGVPQKQSQVVTAPEVVSLRGKFDNVIVYVGGGDRTTDEIKFLLSCLGKTAGNWVLIPRFHPKHMNVKRDGRTLGEMWTEMLTVLEDRVVYVPQVKSSEVVVAAGNMTVASWSTLLTTSACLGIPTVSLWLPSVATEMKELTGLDNFPLAEMGAAHSITEPVDLSSFGPPAWNIQTKLKSYSSIDAYEVII